MVGLMCPLMAQVPMWALIQQNIIEKAGLGWPNVPSLTGVGAHVGPVHVGDVEDSAQGIAH